MTPTLIWLETAPTSPAGPRELWTPSPLQRCWVVDGTGKPVASSLKTKVLYDSAVQKLLGEVGLSLLDAANKSEWHNITRPEKILEALGGGARCSGSRGIRPGGFSPSCRQTALCCHHLKGLHHPHHEQLPAAPR